MIRGLKLTVATIALLFFIVAMVVVCVLRFPFSLAHKAFTNAVAFIDAMLDLIEWAGDSIADWGDSL